MIIFKDKPKKKKNDHPVNIDNKHHEIIKNFESQTKELEILQQELKKKNNKYNELSNISNSFITDEQLDEKFNIKFQIEDIEKKINLIRYQNNSTQYFINTGHILFNYYNKINTSEQVNIELEKKNPLSKSILEFFKKEPVKSNIEFKEDIIKKNTISKTQMMDEYMSYVDSRFITDKNKEDDVEVCSTCNTQKLFVHAEGLMICEKCGVQDYVLIDCDKPSYKEPPKEIAYFAYKRINHFNTKWSGKADYILLVIEFFINMTKYCDFNNQIAFLL